MRISKFVIFLNIFLISPLSYSYTFESAIGLIKKHESIQALDNKSKALTEEGKNKGSWGDPNISIAANNFPQKNLKDGQTPMTGIAFSVSQKIALTPKFGTIEDAYQALGSSIAKEKLNKEQELIKMFWEVLITKRQLREEINIIDENLKWISNISKVSKKLYTNGKISQQALFDIQIRKSELEAMKSNRGYELDEQSDRLYYLLGSEGNQTQLTAIPWEVLDLKSQKSIDNRELALRDLVDAKSKNLTASKLAYVPDLTISLTHTKRANIDNQGDFVSAAVMFSIPLSGSKYSAHSQAAFEKASAQKQLVNYQRSKKSEAKLLLRSIEKQKNELSILENSTLKFAESSRSIVSKSYGLGASSYIELLQSELKLQNLLIQKSKVKALLLKTQVNYKYLVGERLYE